MANGTSTPEWKARGLLFENCSCQLICPAHVSFKQQCTLERCKGYWAIRIEEGSFGGLSLDGLGLVVLYDTPQKMYEGGWTEAIYLDERADDAQRKALETIIRGEAGGPWAVLARFVSTWLETRTVALKFEDSGRRKSLSVEGLLNTEIQALRGADAVNDAVLENRYNTIHGPTHVLARGTSRCSDRGFSLSTEGSHALYSSFSWKGP